MVILVPCHVNKASRQNWRSRSSGQIGGLGLRLKLALPLLDQVEKELARYSGK
jgi:hypothetical protein